MDPKYGWGEEAANLGSLALRESNRLLWSALDDVAAEFRELR
jgi:hypothetical protein